MGFFSDFFNKDKKDEETQPEEDTEEAIIVDESTIPEQLLKEGGEFRGEFVFDEDEEDAAPKQQPDTDSTTTKSFEIGEGDSKLNITMDKMEPEPLNFADEPHDPFYTQEDADLFEREMKKLNEPGVWQPFDYQNASSLDYQWYKLMADSKCGVISELYSKYPMNEDVQVHYWNCLYEAMDHKLPIGEKVPDEFKRKYTIEQDVLSREKLFGTEKYLNRYRKYLPWVNDLVQDEHVSEGENLQTSLNIMNNYHVCKSELKRFHACMENNKEEPHICSEPYMRLLFCNQYSMCVRPIMKCVGPDTRSLSTCIQGVPGVEQQFYDTLDDETKAQIYAPKTTQGLIIDVETCITESQVLLNNIMQHEMNLARGVPAIVDHTASSEDN